MKPFREIRIRPATNGIIVDVGCKPFVYQDNELGSFLVDLKNYLDNPDQIEKEVAEKYGFSLNVPTPTELPRLGLEEQRVPSR